MPDRATSLPHKYFSGLKSRWNYSIGKPQVNRPTESLGLCVQLSPLIVPSKFLCRKRKSDHPFGPRKHTQNSTLQVYHQRNLLLDSVKILTTTQLYMLYNLCVISRYKIQACVVALRILKCCSKCFLAHNPNNPKEFFCNFFFF